MLLLPHDKKNCWVLLQIATQWVICFPPQDQNFRIHCLSFLTCCLLGFIFWKINQNIKHHVWNMFETCLKHVAMLAGTINSTSLSLLLILSWTKLEHFQRFLPLLVNPSIWLLFMSVLECLWQDVINHVDNFANRCNIAQSTQLYNSLHVSYS